MRPRYKSTFSTFSIGKGDTISLDGADILVISGKSSLDDSFEVQENGLWRLVDSRESVVITSGSNVSVRATNSPMVVSVERKILDYVAGTEGEKLPLVSFTKNPDGGIGYQSGDVQPSRIATRIVTGQISVNTAHLGKTAHLVGRLAAPFDAIRLIFMNICATPTVNCKWAISALPVGANLSNQTVVNHNSGTYVTGTVTMPARISANEPSIAFSDWVEIDGESQIFAGRLFVPSDGNTELSLSNFYSTSSTSKGAGWAALAGDEWIMRAAVAGDFVSNIAGLTGTGFSDWALIAGVQYRAKSGRVITVMGGGDSTMSGTWSTLARDAYWVRAVRAAKLAGHAIESCNLGWPSQTTAQYSARTISAIKALRPSICIYSPFSPNDGTPSAANVVSQLQRADDVRAACRAAGIAYSAVTGIPRNSASATPYYTAAQDQFRKSVNEDVVGKRLALDISSTVANGNSFATAAAMRDGMTQDFLHLNEAGNVAASVPVARLIDSVVREI